MSLNLAEATSDPLQSSFQRLYQGRNTLWSLKKRTEMLQKLLKWVTQNQQTIAMAISEDFGNRSEFETRSGEILMSTNGIRHTLSHLHEWVQDTDKPVFWGFLPATARVIRQPKGVIGILSPWNYPFLLAVSPLQMALAAGNRVLIKPSELTPKTAQLLETMVSTLFTPDEVAVVQGGPETGAAFARLPFDHLLFTGSTVVGRKVMLAAAENLTPVTLELGGKSPVVVQAESLKTACERLVVGKLFNAGQTCIAPDYVLLVGAKAADFAAAFAESVKKHYPSLLQNPDYTSIISERHYSRLTNLLQDAKHRGATIQTINPAAENLEGSKKLAPSVLYGLDDSALIMQEEIFGPLLPILEMPDTDAAIRYINQHPRPLALYCFDRNSRRADKVLRETTSGGAAINETLLHIAQDELPFGGIGPSGMGSYHGLDGFRAFSHEKGVFYQARLNGTVLLGAPYTELAKKMIRFLIG
jgi:acyl-CoA reductase-like NAD-dependent aldehyde dehydrogenase